MPDIEIPPHGARFMTQEAVNVIDKPIGLLFLSFSMLDQALDYWLMEVFPLAMKANLGDKMPQLTGQKITYLSRVFERLEVLIGLKSQALTLLRQATELGEIRNTIAHGAISHYIEAPEQKTVFGKLKYSKDRGIHVLDDVVISFSDIRRAADLTSDVVAGMHVIAKQLHAEASSRKPS